MKHIYDIFNLIFAADDGGQWPDLRERQWTSQWPRGAASGPHGWLQQAARGYNQHVWSSIQPDAGADLHPGVWGEKGRGGDKEEEAKADKEANPQEAGASPEKEQIADKKLLKGLGEQLAFLLFIW